MNQHPMDNRFNQLKTLHNRHKVTLQDGSLILIQSTIGCKLTGLGLPLNKGVPRLVNKNLKRH